MNNIQVNRSAVSIVLWDLVHIGMGHKRMAASSATVYLRGRSRLTAYRFVYLLTTPHLLREYTSHRGNRTMLEVDYQTRQGKDSGQPSSVESTRIHVV